MLNLSEAGEKREESKNKRNLLPHGLDLISGTLVFWTRTVDKQHVFQRLGRCLAMTMYLEVQV